MLVTNGVYTGGVSVTNALSLLSVHGPEFTIINGGGVTGCAYLANGAMLSGFTLTNGTAWRGGGICCDWNSPAVVSNCLVVGNQAAGGGRLSGLGGGVSGGTLYNCMLSRNSGSSGGAAFGTTLHDCTSPTPPRLN